jgi:hypothetical protein
MKSSLGAAPWLKAKRARTRSIFHQTINDFFLPDQGEEKNPFCILTVVETNHRKLVMGR